MSNHIEKVKNTLYNRVLEISQPDSLPQNISILMFGHWNTDFQKWVKFKNVSAPPCIITDFINLVSVDFSLYALGIISVLFLKPKLKKKKKKTMKYTQHWNFEIFIFFFFTWNFPLFFCHFFQFWKIYFQTSLSIYHTLSTEYSQFAQLESLIQQKSLWKRPQNDI